MSFRIYHQAQMLIRDYATCPVHKASLILSNFVSQLFVCDNSFIRFQKQAPMSEIRESADKLLDFIQASNFFYRIE